MVSRTSSPSASDWASAWLTIFSLHAEQLRRVLREQILRQGAMAVAGGLEEGVAQAGVGAQGRIGVDAELAGDGVGGFEADAVDVARELVGVGAHLFDGLVAVGFVDADGPAGAGAVGVQEHHDLAHDLLLGPRFLDAFAPFGTDVVDFLQARGLVVDHLEDLVAEAGDEFLGEDGADALDHPAGEVFLDALAGVGGVGAQGFGAELEAVLRVAVPGAVAAHPFPGVDGGQRPEDGDEVVVAAHLDAQDGETVLLVEKSDSFDLAFDVFHPGGTAFNGKGGVVPLNRAAGGVGWSGACFQKNEKPRLTA